MKQPKETCDLCQAVVQSILINFNHLPIDRARVEALKVFREIPKDTGCASFYTCLPMIRLQTKAPSDES